MTSATETTTATDHPLTQLLPTQTHPASSLDLKLLSTAALIAEISKSSTMPERASSTATNS